MTIRVGIANPHSLSRRGLAHLLQEAEIDVVAQAADGEGALRIASTAEPDVLLVELDMPDLGGIEVARRVAREQPHVGVIVLASADDPRTAGDVVRAGARAFVAETTDPPGFVETVRLVASGHAVMDPRTWTEAAESEPAEADGDALSSREVQILRLVAKGHTNAHIAKSLGLSRETVKTHVERIRRRLGAADRTEAVATALRYGFID